MEIKNKTEKDIVRISLEIQLTKEELQELLKANRELRSILDNYVQDAEAGRHHLICERIKRSDKELTELYKFVRLIIGF